MAAIHPAVNFGNSDQVEELTHQIKKLEFERQRLYKQNLMQKKSIITLERKLSKFNEVQEQRDWLLDEMTKKIGELSRFHSDAFKSERFTAIGEMAARLAHDMRNPLAIIKNTVEIVKLKYSATIPPDLFTLFASIDNASSRLVFQLDEVLNFVRRSPLEFGEYSLLGILDSAINKIVIPDQIEINKPKNDVYVVCDKEKIEAVFTNLIMNAIQAMENCGEVNITFLETSDSVVFKVQDFGSGIEERTMDKIFEPLFTTKSRGTGLGLPVVKTIIQQHQGSITVCNDPTTFCVSLPKQAIIQDKIQ